MERKLKPIFDSGHGGVIGGRYQTLGKRSPDLGQGILYEGMFNRWVVNRLIEKCDRAGIPYYHASPELADVSLSKRVQRTNEIYQQDKDVYLISIHANAGGGEGIEGFTSIGQTLSDVIAEHFLKDLQITHPGTRHRHDLSDGDLDKEKNFWILRHTHCAAFLLECGFMDNQKDYQRLWSEEYLESIVCSLFNTIVKLYQGL